jgi:hypothetical protein
LLKGRERAFSPEGKLFVSKSMEEESTTFALFVVVLY